MSHRLDYESPTARSKSRARRWVLAVAAGAGLWWATAVVVTGARLDLSLNLRRGNTLAAVASWAAAIAIPTLVAVVAAWCVLHTGSGNKR